MKVEENTKNKMKNPLWKQPGLDRLICVLVASIALFVVQIVMSHITHSLTLLVASYHMLYNIFSLIGCIATIKVLENYFLHLQRKKRTIWIHLFISMSRRHQHRAFVANVNNTWNRANFVAAMRYKENSTISLHVNSVKSKSDHFYRKSHLLNSNRKKNDV